MIRKLERVGLLVLAICALGIVAAAPAAAEFHSSAEHTILDGKQVGTDSLVFNAGKITCTSITYSGTLSAKTSTTASLTPAYSGCNAFGFIGVTIDTNGCQLVLHTTSELTDISCGEKPITVTAPNCTLTIGSQTGLTSSTYAGEGTTPRDVRAKFALTKLKYTQAGLGGTPCTSKEFSDGSYAAEATITGTDTSGNQIHFGTESPPPPAGRFHSSTLHTSFDGEQILGGEDAPTFNIGTFICDNITYGGTQSEVTPAKIALTPTFVGCENYFLGSIPVHVNGCKWIFEAPTSGTNKLEISCPGAPMEITFNVICTVTIGSQVLTGVTYTSQGETPKRDVKFEYNLTGIKYTQHSNKFPGCKVGTFSDGTWVGGATVKGTDTASSQVDFWYA
jgi:hypothetical protein